MPRSERRGALRRNEQGKNEIFKNLVTGNMQTVGEWEAEQAAYRAKRKKEVEETRARKGRPEYQTPEMVARKSAARRARR